MSPYSSPVSASPAPKASGKRNRNFQNQLLMAMESLENRIDKEHQEMVAISKEMAETDKRNSNLLKEFVKSSVAMNSAFIEHLQKRDS